MKLIFTLNIISKIGGIETWLYNMASQLSNEYDILILYESCDIEQARRLSKIVNIKKMEKAHVYTCDVCIIGSTITPFYNNINASRYIQMVHCDFSKISKNFFILRDIPNLEYVTVSNAARSGLWKAFHIGSSVIQNPLGIKREPRRILRLISCTRLTEEKGYGRMKILAKALKDNNIKFEWKIFTDYTFENQQKMEYDEIIYRKPSLDIIDEIANSDYGVQLSDTESYGYFIHECLQYEVPVIATKLPCLKDIKFIDGVHGYLLNFDMSNLDVDKIYNEIPMFEKPVQEKDSIRKWKKILGFSDTKTKVESDVQVKILQSYYDKYLHRTLNAGDTVYMPVFRSNLICSELGLGKLVGPILEV